MKENICNLPISILEFKAIDPVQVGEEWAMYRDNPPRTVEIYIDGCELLDIIRPIELPYKKKEGFDISTEDYGHMPVSELYRYLITAMDGTSYSYKYGVYLLVCRDCGEPGCWSVTCKVSEDEKYVYWLDFEHEHRDWEYNIQYKFEKKQYNEALKKIGTFS
jgi:hypothetical protein